MDEAHRLALALARSLEGNGDGSFPRHETGPAGKGTVPVTRHDPSARHESGGPDVLLHHTCPTCGSSEHGVPYAEASGRRVALSVSRAPGAIAAAAIVPAGCVPGPGSNSESAVPASEPSVGIDIERSDAAGFDGFAAVALHPDEPLPASTLAATRLWVRKEAVLKALGSGLRIDPRTVRLSSGDQSHPPRVLAWPDPRPASLLDLRDLDAPVGYVAALAVIGGSGAAYTQVAIRPDRSDGV